MKLRNYAISFVIGGGIFGIGGAYLGKIGLDPKEVIVHGEDFNRDGVADLVVEQSGGHKFPMYGIDELESRIYISGDEMRKRNPDSMIDYEAIEYELNMKDYFIGMTNPFPSRFFILYN
jgi:hypothetical protein